MKKGDFVQVYSGPYTGYYGSIVEIKGDIVTVTHKPDFAGFQIAIADLEPPKDD